MSERVEHVFKLSGLRCANCARTAQKAIEQLPDVDAQVNFATEEAIVRTPASLAPDVVIKTIEAAGYGATQVLDVMQVAEAATDRTGQIRFAVALVCALPLLLVMPWMLFGSHEVHIPIFWQFLLLPCFPKSRLAPQKKLNFATLKITRRQNFAKKYTMTQIRCLSV